MTPGGGATPLPARGRFDCPPGYLIRAGTPADHPRLVEVENAAGRLFATHGYPRIAEDGFDNVEQLRAVLDGGSVYVAADTDGSPVGFALARPLADYLHLRELAVDPAHGRKGLGGALVQAVLAHGMKAGVRGVSLTTFRTVPFNQPFYESQGFRELPVADAPPCLAEAFWAEIPHGIEPDERLIMQFSFD
ncbi:GNAT family N-acetyltransferase [Mesorhizobium sp. Z1-4]|uniref:GNAT family N-acetyltransferase n=1 Tax=Mesorhizobium sp. Z1-4 TaxID=2448478 RepID=UPI001FDF2561|nr:GNAT family N-acetyltransferase [Mesorhizobium sp. Z1-4]